MIISPAGTPGTLPASPSTLFDRWNGALLVQKPAGISSFGVIERLQRALQERHGGLKRKFLPKVGHGGTLDPFATGLLVICVGNGVKLARYFLGSDKVYEGIIRFGTSTASGDPTTEVIERSTLLPSSQAEIQAAATELTRQPYLQTPPMHSAKKLNGKPLYELARQGIEVDRVAKSCTLYQFDIRSFATEADAVLATFHLKCSSGTYVRTLAQDLAKKLGTVAMLDTLDRVASGDFHSRQALTLQEVIDASLAGQDWDKLSAWIPFDQMLGALPRVEISESEALSLMRGQQGGLSKIIERYTDAFAAGASEAASESSSANADADADADVEEALALFNGPQLVAVARREDGIWGLERVFAAG